MEQSLLLWGFALLAAALLLVLVEVFVPSGGIIGMVAGVTAIAAVVVFWRVSAVWGITSMLLLLVLAPMAANFALRVMPHTPIGKRLILGADDEDNARRAAVEQEQHERLSALVGATGVALTSLHPVGTASIEGTRLEVLAEGGMIEPGTKVRVTAVEGNQVRVRAVV